MLIKLILFALPLFLILSCSDDTPITPTKQDCFLMAYTDSANYYFEIEYDNGLPVSLFNYKFKEGKKDFLVSRIDYKRNFFKEITNLNHYDKNGGFDGVDSIFSSANGLPYDVISYNNMNKPIQKISRIYDKTENTIERKIFKFEDRWVLTINYKYEYDSQNRVIASVREQIQQDGSQYDTTAYSYDNMKNINSSFDLFSVFTKNNFKTVTTSYTLQNGSSVTETKTYEYEYNSERYPVKTKITSSVDPNDVKYKYNIIDCPN